MNCVLYIPNLKQNFWTHAEETIDNTEGEYHWHTIDKSERTGEYIKNNKLMAPTNSETMVAKRLRVGHRLLESGRESWEDIFEQGLQRPVDPGEYRTWRG